MYIYGVKFIIILLLAIYFAKLEMAPAIMLAIAATVIFVVYDIMSSVIVIKKKN
jgi:hypothetical protein